MNTNQFTPEQIEQMRTWMPELRSISEFQTKLNTTFQTHLTYMETRFLMDDLNLQLAETNQKTEESHKRDNMKQLMEGEVVNDENTSSVRVEIDPVTRPGALANGKVVFSDGKTASWTLDQLGRIALNPTQIGYRPNQNDLAQFQAVLQQKLSENARGNVFGF